MNAFFASAALGLVAAWPASGLGWLLGKAADRLTDDPAPRAAAWNRAVALPPAILGAMMGISLLPEETTDPVYQVALSSEAIASAGVAMNEVAVRALSGFNALETAGVVLVLSAAGGLAIAAVRQAIGRVKLERIVRESRPADTDLALAVRAAARRMDTGRPEVRISDQIDQPLLAGLSTPVILLPTELVERLGIDRLAPICAHELGHLKRGDNWRLMFEHLLGGLLWMVPPFALLRARAAAAREELCDALALDGAATEIRVSYAESLIEVLRSRAAPTFQPAFTGKGPRTILMRLKAITEPRQPAGITRKVLLGLTTALAVTAAGAASIALAQQSAHGSKTRTTISADNGQYIDIRSDYVRVTNAELIDGKVKVPDGQMSTYHGNVQVRGRLRAPETQVLLNGKAPPAGFDATDLPKGAIDAVELTSFKGDRKPHVILNVVMKPSA
jgi:beta-lactamase regulating signal transducer with metallopeptidase domain